MRYALISDIHGNLAALEAVLDDIASRPDIVGTFHLGDLVGYSPFPNEVVALLHERNVPGVSGNYDSTVATNYKHCGCRASSPREEELAHVSYAWTLEAVTAETRRRLAALPFRLDLRPFGAHVAGPTVTLVHATPTNNLVYVTEDRPDSFLTRMSAGAGLAAGDVLCFGHTHKPWERTVDGVHFVNTGSVGRPKDGDWRACYVLLEFAETEPAAEFVRVEYDIDRTIAAISKAGLPEDFATFLKTGGKLAEVAAGE